MKTKAKGTIVLKDIVRLQVVAITPSQVHIVGHIGNEKLDCWLGEFGWINANKVKIKIIPE